MEKLSQKQIKSALTQLPGWQVKGDAIEADFKFKNFFETFSFMIKIATEAERMQHHPDWSNVYNQVHIKLSTHEARGVTQLDIDLATTIAGL